MNTSVDRFKDKQIDISIYRFYGLLDSRKIDRWVDLKINK